MPVLTARVEQKPMPVTLPAVGTVEAIASVQIRAQVTGQLSAIHFAEGQEVQKGQPLFSLDARPFQAALRQAEAVLARDTATLQNAQAQLARSQSLVERGLVTRDQYETQRAAVASLTATVAADAAAIETARLNVQYTEILAPISGRTGALGAHIGDLVRANDTTPLVVINQMSPVYVTFSVPGRFLSEIRRYQAQRPLTVTAVDPDRRRHEQPAPAGTRHAADPATRVFDLEPGDRAPGDGRGGRRRELHRQRGGLDDGHDPTEGDVPERRSPAVAGRLRAGDAEPDDRRRRAGRSGDRRAGVAGRAVRVRRQVGPDASSCARFASNGSRAARSSSPTACPPARSW